MERHVIILNDVTNPGYTVDTLFFHSKIDQAMLNIFPAMTLGIIKAPLFFLSPDVHEIMSSKIGGLDSDIYHQILSDLFYRFTGAISLRIFVNFLITIFSGFYIIGLCYGVYETIKYSVIPSLNIMNNQVYRSK